jgi:hypothetical protein
MKKRNQKRKMNNSFGRKYSELEECTRSVRGRNVFTPAKHGNRAFGGLIGKSKVGIKLQK